MPANFLNSRKHGVREDSNKDDRDTRLGIINYRIWRQPVVFTITIGSLAYREQVDSPIFSARMICFFAVLAVDKLSASRGCNSSDPIRNWNNRNPSFEILYLFYISVRISSSATYTTALFHVPRFVTTNHR